MQPTIYTFLIVCPLVFLAGFVDAVAGGGGLISLPAYLLAGVPIHNAVATNKLILWTRNRNFSPAFVYRIGKNECGKSFRYHEGYQPLF